MKNFYDHLKSVEVEKCKNSVPKLFLAGMDEEALWQQLELQNNFTIDQLLERTSNYLAMKYDTLKFDYQVEGGNSEEDEEDDNQQLDSNEDDDDGGWEDLGEDGEVEGEQEEDDFAEENDEEEDEEGENEEHQENADPDHDDNEDDPSTTRRDRKTTNLDDDFFKLKELNRFLDEEDRKEMNSMKKKKFGDEDEDEDGVDLFQDLDAVDEDEDGAADMKFADFFEKPTNAPPKKKKHFRDDEEDEEEEEEIDTPDRRVQFDLKQNEEFSDNDNNDDDENAPDSPDNPQSSHEERQDRLKKRMERLEEKSIGDKPWQLKGEVRATARPENSLLEEYLEFDSATRPAPLITEETTQRLDDIILQRIKDRAYDDVQRKVRPSDNGTEFRKQLVLDQAKSKESLAQIYEKDYMDKVAAATDKDKDANVLEEEEQPVLKKEIREKMRQLMAKLDALSNFHFTPKPAAPEIKIITNTPAIEMEEAAPVAVSEATMLAPEEVKRPNKGDLIGRTERTRTDKNRERRRKKMKQRLAGEKETAGGKMGKETLEKVTKARNVQKVSEGE